MLKSVKYLDATSMLRSSHGDIDGETDVSPGPPLGESEFHDHEVIGEMDGLRSDDLMEDGEENPGHRVEMRLVQRPQMTTLALPTSSTWPSEAIPPHTAPWYFLPDILAFSRFMLASPEYMLSELERELQELKAEWDLLRGDDLGRDFVRAAKEKVERQIGKVHSQLVTPGVQRSEEEGREAWLDAESGQLKERLRRREHERLAATRNHAEVLDDVPPECLAAQSTSFGSGPFGQSQFARIPPNLPVQPNPMPSSRRSRRRPPGSQVPVQTADLGPAYYFYQSTFGANVFLHPLDIRILLAHFKSYALFPQRISFESHGFSSDTVNDDLKKRCKYLGHLPAGTEVIFVEADLEPIVGLDTLVAFDQPLRSRRNKRRDRTRKEDRAKLRWEKAERERNPAAVMMPSREERDVVSAIILSTHEAEGQAAFEAAHPRLGSSPLQPSTPPGPSPSSSPPALATWGAHAQSRPTFATALHSAHASSPTARGPQRTLAAPSQSDGRLLLGSEGEREDRPWETDAVWDAFDRLAVKPEAGTPDSAPSSDKVPNPTSGKKPKKSAKKTLVLGGGGRRA